MRPFLCLALTLGALAAAAAPAAGAPRAGAVRRAGAIEIDGRLDDPGWSGVTAAGGFVQRFPDEGKPPSHPTEFRVVYDDEAIYVAVRAFDDEPAKIRGLLTRRDQDSASDWIVVGLDSYADRRTAYVFWINPAGVQRDELVFNDGELDASWDAVWSAAARIDEQGWTAELRIPLSQLRFAAQDHHAWGLQVVRAIARTGEQSTWSPWPRSGNQIVSRFGTLDGLDGLAPGRRLEVLPYVSAGVDARQVDPGDPFRGPARALAGAGVDVRYGLGPAFTLAATVNPDFGQVEADPSQVNLTAMETFFPEKRPFFLEGTELFRFALQQGDGGGAEGLFYTRRIGARPHLDGCALAAYCDQPEATTIYGAAKISGKTRGGWSLGVLEAVTAAEHAELAGGPVDRVAVEPLASYTVARVLKDLRGGATTVAGIATAVHRDLSTPALAATLHDRAYAGGLDASHRFGADRWGAQIWLFGSWVHGAPEAIAADQRHVRHLYQRPDATHVTLDATRTSLAGAGALWNVGRWNHPRWNFGTGGDVRTPGLEVNDLGFQRGADFVDEWIWVGYRDDTPGKRLLSWGASAEAWAGLNLEGAPIGGGASATANAQLATYWGFSGGVGVDRPWWDFGALRGGPRLRATPGWSAWLSGHTDGRKRVSGGASGSVHRTDASDSWRGAAGGWLSIQARPNVELTLGADAAVVVDDTQYVTRLGRDGGTTDETRYVLARLRQTVGSATVRVSWTFSPRLSLQLYAQPFVAAGAYGEYKQASDTYAAAYADRFDVYGPGEVREVDGQIVVTRGGEAFGFGKPDFAVRELRGNLVLRWEYRPGSTVFVIWSHDRGAFDDAGQLRPGADLRALAAAPGEHVVMVKATYWTGL